MNTPLPRLLYAVAAIVVLAFASRALVASLKSVEQLVGSFAP